MQAFQKQAPQRIAIIGGGPGGLTLARILHTRGITATVFESEDSPTARQQGGTLDIHVESGQRALQLAGLWEEFLAHARYEDQGFRLYGTDGELLFDESDAANGGRPEIDRTSLRQILLDSLPEGLVRWGHKLRGVQPLPDGSFEVSFENGVNGAFDFVVGADGTWSRVRPLLSAVRPGYSGITFIELQIDDADRRFPEISRMVGRGKIFALSASKGIIAQRSSNAHIRVYAALRVAESWLAEGGIDLSSPAAARAWLLAEFEGWSPSLLNLIASSDDRMAARPLHALPSGHCWENRPGFTLIGDAAHVMSPFSGEGANLAMLDAAELALVLAEGGDWTEAVKAFEVTMAGRAGEAAAAAGQALEDAFSENGTEIMLGFMQGRPEQEME